MTTDPSDAQRPLGIEDIPGAIKPENAGRRTEAPRGGGAAGGGAAGAGGGQGRERLREMLRQRDGDGASGGAAGGGGGQGRGRLAEFLRQRGGEGGGGAAAAGGGGQGRGRLAEFLRERDGGDGQGGSQARAALPGPGAGGAAAGAAPIEPSRERDEGARDSQGTADRPGPDKARLRALLQRRAGGGQAGGSEAGAGEAGGGEQKSREGLGETDAGARGPESARVRALLQGRGGAGGMEHGGSARELLNQLQSRLGASSEAGEGGQRQALAMAIKRIADDYARLEKEVERLQGELADAEEKIRVLLDQD